MDEYDEIFPNEKIPELQDDLDLHKDRKLESRTSSEFHRSTVEDISEKSRQKEVEINEISKDDLKTDNVLIKTEELIDLYNADPVTGRAKEKDIDLCQESDLKKEEKQEIQSEESKHEEIEESKEEDQEENKEEGQDESDQDRREYPIERLLPPNLPKGKSKTVKGYHVEEKWVSSSSHSSSFKVKNQLNLSPPSQKGMIGIFSSGNFETAKSKELISRNSD